MRGALLSLAFLGTAWSQCEDLTNPDGSEWHDPGGVKYTCSYWYKSQARCDKYGGSDSENNGLTGNEACCTCGGGDGVSFSSGSMSGSSGSCTVDESWEDSKYGDTCDDYISGKSQKYNCGATVKEKCCTCQDGAKTSSSSSSSSSSSCKIVPDWEHPKYGDDCESYKTGKSKKYACSDKEAMQNCCSCETSSSSSSSSSSGTCEVDKSWTHPSYKDDCDSYISGKSKKYACDSQAKAACCTCQEDAKSSGASGSAMCTDKKAGSDTWHDSYGEKYDCSWYASKSTRCDQADSETAWGGMTAKEACCTCDGGEYGATCTDSPGWYEDGKPDYDCDWYAQKDRCAKYGGKYEGNNGKTASQSCCACGGGEMESGGAEAGFGSPEPDKGDNIALSGEWLGDTQFFAKKHLAGGFVLYWNVDDSKQTVTVGMLSPEKLGSDEDSWMGLGFSPSGGMAGSDAFVIWFDPVSGEPVISDKYLRNQSPSGVLDSQRQEAKSQKAWKFGSRMAMVVERPWMSSKGGVEIKVKTDFVNIIYSHGKYSTKCKPFCNHAAGNRWTAQLAMTAPEGMKLYDLNKGNFDEPCDGVADLECADGLYCYHADAQDGDVWAKDSSKYGGCKNPQEEGEGDTGADDNDGQQTVFANDGGFEHKEQLRGGFVLMWSINKVSPPGAFGPDDTISVAVVSTAKDKQGWIGFGFSPNGEMKGSDVVIGWSDGSNTKIGDYFLTAQISNKNKEANKQELVNARVIKKNGQLALTFERKMTPADSVQILEGSVHTIFASGPTPDEDDTEFIPYHRYRAEVDVEFLPIADDLADANKVGMFSLCLGPANLECKNTLICQPFDMEMMKNAMGRTNMTERREQMESGEGREGFTSASDWGGSGRSGQRSNNSMMEIFSNISNLEGKGMCVNAEMAAGWDSYGAAYEMAAVSAVRDAGYQFYQKLRWGFDLYWDLMDKAGNVIPKNSPDFLAAHSIKLALVAAIGPGWIGIGMGTQGQMLGANAIVGWYDAANPDGSKIMEYYLEEKLPWMIQPIESESESMQIMNIEVINQGHENALILERPLRPTNGMAPINPGLHTIIYAVGNVPRPVDDYFGYHRFRESAEVAFIPEEFA